MSIRLSYLGICCIGSWLLSACASDDTGGNVVGASGAPEAGRGDSPDSGGEGGTASSAPANVGYPMLSVVFGDEANTTYLSVLDSLAVQDVSHDGARELAGWADLWVLRDKLFVADGEAPVLTRYSLAEDRALVEEGKLSFQAYGTDNAAFWGHLFVDERKAYWFNTSQREVVIWNPQSLEIESSFALPALPDRVSQTLAGPTADRSSVVRGDRAYVPFYWADWTDYELSEDSVILVIDTQSNEVIDALSVPCPEINFATTTDDGTIYFSNWGYSAIPTLLDGKAQACAVRVLPGTDQLDPDWSLTFADVTEGREASSLRYVGDGKALLTVLHDERLEVTADADRFALTDSANWRLWLLDLTTLEAEPLDALGWHAPGLYGTRVGGETLLSVPSAAYDSSTTYRFSADGSAEKLWQSTGWQTRLFALAPAR